MGVWLCNGGHEKMWEPLN